MCGWMQCVWVLRVILFQNFFFILKGKKVRKEEFTFFEFQSVTNSSGVNVWIEEMYLRMHFMQPREIIFNLNQIVWMRSLMIGWSGQFDEMKMRWSWCWYWCWCEDQWGLWDLGGITVPLEVVNGWFFI